MAGDEAFSLKAGEVLAGKYRIEKVLGRGGMGVVAAAVHVELGTRVALKILLPGATGDLEAIERFAREARAASQLRSEHVVRVFDVGKLEDNTPFLVMEHLEGVDFDDLLERTPVVPPVEAVDYILQACEGIAEAHAAGIVHRDLKPGNLFLTRRVDGRPIVKVVDFGLAKEQSQKSLASLTAPLIAVGSPEYMSPEQTRALDVDARTDIWSLGICLYELLTGTTPFEAPTVMDICARVLTDSPRSPARLNADIPAELSNVVMRCLQKDRARRYPDIGALAEALEELGPPSQKGVAERIRQVLSMPRLPRPALEPAPLSESVANVSLSGRSRRRRSAALVGVAVVAVVAAAVVWNVRAAKPVEAMAPPATSATATPPEESSGALPSIGLQAPRPVVAAAPPSQPRTLAATTHRGKRRVAGAAPSIDRVFPTGPEPGPSAVTAAAPPVAAPPAAAPSTPAPRFVLASAHVEVGGATNTVGTTASNVNRAIAPLAAAMTNCYRAALPQAAGAVDGAGTLHVETDEEGIITSARATGPLPAAARCIGGTAAGRRVPNVDTGRASADIPLVFKGQ